MHFDWTFLVRLSALVLPAVIALIAENTGHVKAVGAMTNVQTNRIERSWATFASRWRRFPRFLA